MSPELLTVLGDLRALTNDPLYQLEFLEEMEYILVEKGADYNRLKDFWSSFRVASEVTNIPIDHVFLSFIGTKISRLCSLAEAEETPNFESIEDSWLDLANYIVLLIAYKKHEASQCK